MQSAVSLDQAIEALGTAPLTEAAIAHNIRPLFQRLLTAGDKTYLATNALGLPLDQVELDVVEGMQAWSAGATGAWQPWLAEEQRYRAALAALLGLQSADSVVPKASAGQALRAILNTLPPAATVVTTLGEFASIAVVLAQYQAAGRLRVVRVDATADALIAGIDREPEVHLAVVSQVLYASGRIVQRLAEASAACRSRDAELVVDCYHSLGVLPVRMEQLGCGYMIGGCYKYLRGGPGAGFLAVAPRLLRHQRQHVDVGWFALESGGTVWGPRGPQLRAGGDGWLDGTPAVLAYYQARSGLALALGLGLERLRAYQLGQTAYLRELLATRDVACVGGGPEHGAFLTVELAQARAGGIAIGDAFDRLIELALAERNVVATVREGVLRLCPDLLTTCKEMERASQAVASCLHRSP
jgi:kynureninase